MGEALNSETMIREYLLGRVSDETTLEGLEDRLFTDEEFCSQLALAEDGIINDYLFGRLNNADAESFRATLAIDPERRFKLELAQAIKERAQAKAPGAQQNKISLLASLGQLFRKPLFAGAVAVALIALLVLAVYLSKGGSSDELAELRSMYEQARQTESRISEFSYAPLTQQRGASEPAGQNRFRHIEIRLIEANEENPNAQTHHALGIFKLTRQQYSEAIKEFEAASRFEGNAKIYNDLGVAYFERAKTQPKEKRLVDLGQSVEEFRKAITLDGNLLEALFNQSLALQELGLTQRAKDSWNLYLQKDASSPWADEARKHLSRLDNEQTLFKDDQQVLSDFLTAYRNHDFERAQTIHNETKGLLRTPAVALQLSLRYLIARQRGDEREAGENLAAMAYIGSFEQAQHSEFFFLS